MLSKITDENLIQFVKTQYGKRKLIFGLCFIFAITVFTLQAGPTGLIKFSAGTAIESAEINKNFKIVAPPGSITPYAGPVNKKPEGWLVCDGSEISRTVYNELFDIIGEHWGAGDGTDTFNLPDLRGRFLRGVDAGAGNDLDAGSRTEIMPGGITGDEVGSFQDDAIRNITGYFGNGDDNFNAGDAFYIGGVNGDASSHSSSGRYVIFDASRMVPTGQDNRPKNAAVLYLIKY